MSEMSFKQAKELVEKIELSELSLKRSIKDMENSSAKFDEVFTKQEEIINIVPKMNSKVTTLRVLLALNFGFIIGLLVGKFFF